MIVFTIAARNFISNVRVLEASLRRHNKGVKFYLALCDRGDGFDRDDLGFDIIDLDQLTDRRIWAMCELYNVTEFCTAIKPFVFKYLMHHHPDMPICYLDPDIYVVSRLEELDSAFAGGASAVLTPHALKPSPRPELFPDNTMLKFGCYNLGFLGLRDSKETRTFIDWWCDRLETECIIDIPNGMFVDQKWADLIPSFLNNVHVLRHPGYNVAYWNMLDRRVTFDDGWTVDGEPLRFAHFSGHDLTRPDVFSRHAWFLDKWVIGDLSHLLSLYREEVVNAGFFKYGRLNYSYKWAGASINLHTPVSISKKMAAASDVIGRELTPFQMSPTSLADDLFSLSVDSWDDYQAKKPLMTVYEQDHRAFEYGLLLPDEQSFYVQGVCSMCRAKSIFHVGYMYAARDATGRTIPNWREHLDCTCGFQNRIRAAMHALQADLKPQPDASIYITERVTPLFKWLRLRWPNICGSEYFGPSHEKGKIYKGVQHEDVCDLTLPDKTYDMAISFDVLEHVENLNEGLFHLHRILRDGGKLLFAAPTQLEEAAVVDRVLVNDDGSYTHLVEPEYHGNPVDAEGGALCFRYLGLEVLDTLRKIGFRSAKAVFYWSKDYGYLGSQQMFYVAEK